MIRLLVVVAAVVISEPVAGASEPLDEIAGALNAGKLTLCEGYLKLRPMVEAVPRVWRMSYPAHRRDQKWVKDNTDKYVEARTLYLDDQVQQAMASVVTAAIAGRSAEDIEKALRDADCIVTCEPAKPGTRREDLPPCQLEPWVRLLPRARSRIAEIRAEEQCAADPSCPAQRKVARRRELEDSLCADTRRREHVLAKIQDERKYAGEVGVVDLAKLQSLKERLQELDRRLSRNQGLYQREVGGAFKVEASVCDEAWRDLATSEPENAWD